MRHVLGANFEYDNDANDLLSHIYITDAHALIATWLEATYPTGYPYHIWCTENIDKCQHVTRKNLHFGASIWPNSTRITADMRNFIGDAKTIKTKVDLEKYRKMSITDKVIDVSKFLDDGDVRIVISIPNMKRYFEESDTWLNTIDGKVLATFRDTIDDERRQAYINELRMVTLVRRYTPYFKEVIFYTEDGEVARTIKPGDELNNFIDSASELGKEFYEFISAEIATYINSSKMSAVGYYREACPSCGALPKTDSTYSNELIELDIINDFFTLVQERAIFKLN
jgi:hypothetical protein